MNEDHLQELLFSVMKQRDAYKQIATEAKVKLDQKILEVETVKIQNEGLLLRIRELEARIEDLDVGNKFLLKALRKTNK